MKRNTLAMLFMMVLLCLSRLSPGAPIVLTLSISGPSVACVGSVSTYSVAPQAGDTYYWSVMSGGHMTSTNPSDPATVMWDSPGTDSVKVVQRNATGTAIDSAINIVTVYPAPLPYITTTSVVACQNLDTAAGDATKGDTPQPLILSNADGCIKVCDSSVVKYMANSNVNGTYKWLVIGGTILGPDTGPSVLVDWGAPGSGSLTLVDTGIGGCVSSVTICFDILARPEALFAIEPNSGPAASYDGCLDATLIFQDLSTADAGSPIISWYWLFGDGGSSSSQNPTHVYTASGGYYVQLIVTNACGCADTFGTQVGIEKQQGPNIYCPHEVCENDTASYSTDKCSTGTYNWNIVGSGGTIIAGWGTPSITVQWGTGSPDGFGYVSLQVLGCVYCPGTTTIKVPVVQSKPVLSGPPNPVCTNTQVQFSIPLWPGVQYDWGVVGDPGAVISSHNSNVVTLEFTTPGAYALHYWWQSRTNLCGGDRQYIINVQDPPTIVGSVNLCAGSTSGYILSSSASASWVLQGPGGYIQYGSGTSFTGSFPVSGTYILSASDPSFCAPPPLTIDVEPSPPAPNTISGDTQICYGQPYTYKATVPVAGTNFYWTIIPSGSGMLSSSTGDSVVVTWTAPGTIYVALQGTNIPYCTGPALSLNVTPFPLNPAITGAASVCMGSNAGYNDHYRIADATTWAIYPNTAGSVTAGIYDTVINVLWNNVASVTTAALVVTIQKCDSVRTDTLHVTVNPGPPDTLLPWPSAQYCGSATVTFTATAGAATYNWDFGDGNSSVTAGNTTTHVYDPPHTHTVIPFVATVFTSGASGAGCPPTGVGLDTIKIYPGPNVSISTTNPTFYCTGGGAISTSFSATLTPGTYIGPVTYQWYLNGVPIAGATNHAYIATAVGNYSAEVTDHGIPLTCPAPSQTVPITMGACGGVIATCTTSPISLSYVRACNVLHVTGTGSGTSYWYVDPGYSSLSTGGSAGAWTCDLAYPGIGRYHVQLTEVFGSCNSYKELQIDVPLIANFSYGFSCGTTSYGLVLTDRSRVLAGYGISTPRWKVTSASASYSGSGYNLTFTGLTPDSTYTVTETVKLSPSGDSCTSTQVITMPKVTTVAFGDLPNPICEGVPVKFTDTVGGTLGITSELWNFGDGATVGIDNPSRNYRWTASLNPDVYTATLTVQNSIGCTVTKSHTVSIYHNLMAGSVSGPSPIVTCGTPATLTYTGTPTPSSYLWSDGATTASDIVNLSGAYFVTVNDIHSCQLVTQPRNVIVLNGPGLDIQGKSHYCAGDDVKLSGYVGADYTYQWTRNSAAIPGATAPQLVDAGLPAGTYVYSLTVTHTYTTASGTTVCSYTSPGFNVTVNSLPPAPGITGPSVVSCPLYEMKLYVTTMLPGATYNWSNGAFGSSIIVDVSGAYRVWVTDTNGCVNYSDIDVPPSPESFSGWIPDGCYDICGSFVFGGGLNLYGPPGTFQNWTWLMNGTPDGAGANSTVSALPITGPGDYQLVIDNGLCTDTLGNMDVTIRSCECSAGIVVYDTTFACDPGSPGVYSVTLRIYNGYGVAVSGTIGMDIGPVYPMPVTIVAGPPHWNFYTFSFTTLDVPPPTTINGWLHYYTPSGECYTSFTATIPYPCGWLDEKPGHPGATTQSGAQNKSTGMLVYPNPARNAVTVNYNFGTIDNTADRRIVVYDVFGRTIANEKESNVTGAFSLSFNDIAAGVYIVKMEENGQTVQSQHLSVTH